MASTNQFHLTKHHGLANDFLVAIEPPRPVTKDDVVAWCHRRTGIGADGVMMATALPGGRWAMTLWNADGGEAEISGNGIRCLAQALADHVGHDRADALDLTIETAGRSRVCTVLARPNGDASTDQIRVAMGKAVPGPDPSSRWDELGIAVTHQVGVDVGNPHIVAVVEDFPEQDIAEIGPIVEADYPAGCNVHLVKVDGPDHLTMKIWERGSGVTQACGSGASAAAWATNQVGLVGTTVAVEMPGGAATVELQAGEVILTGPAVRVADVLIPIEATNTETFPETMPTETGLRG